MRKYTMLVCMTVFSLVGFSQNITQKDVENKVKQYIMDKSTDYKSYEPVSFEKVEKFMTSYFMTDEYKIYFELAQSAKKIVTDYQEMMKGASVADKGVYRREATEALKKAQELVETISKNEKKYMPYQYGWQVLHKYRAKDAYNLQQYNVETFYLDKDLNVVQWDEIKLVYANK